MSRLSTVLIFAVLCAVTTAAAQDVEGLLKQGDLALKSKKYEEAIKAYGNANKAAGEKCSKCLVRLAIAKASANDERGAIKAVDRAIEVADAGHELAEAHSMKGEILGTFAAENQKKLAQAESEYRQR